MADMADNTNKNTLNMVSSSSGRAYTVQEDKFILEWMSSDVQDTFFSAPSP